MHYVMFYQSLHKILSNALIFWNGTIYQKLKFFLMSGKDHPHWLLTKMDQMMDQFSDINEGEKEFMKMWNLHMMVILILEYFSRDKMKMIRFLLILPQFVIIF